MEPIEFVEAYGVLIAAYSNIPGDIRTGTYEAALLHLPAEAFRHAVDRAVGELKFFPTVAELRGFARQYLEMTGALYTPTTAWDRALRACNTYIPRLREQVAYPSPLIKAVIERIGGPASVAFCKADFLDAKRREFLRLYEDMALTARYMGIDTTPVDRRYILLPGATLADGTAIGGPENVRVWDTVRGEVVPPVLYEMQEAAIDRGHARELGTGDNSEDRRATRQIAGAATAGGGSSDRAASPLGGRDHYG